MALFSRHRSRYLFYFCLILFIPLLLSVFNLQSERISQESNPKPSRKSHHLILGHATGEGLPNRLQCQGLKAVNKDAPSRSHEKLGVSEAVSLVTVFTVYNNSLRSDSSKLVTVGNVSCSKEERSLAILNVFIDFIQNVAGVHAKKQSDHID